MAFASMLRQECGWFDEEEHSVGILAANLSGDAANLQTVSFYFIIIFGIQKNIQFNINL